MPSLSPAARWRWPTSSDPCLLILDSGYVEPVTRLHYLHQRSDPLTYLPDSGTGRPYEWNFGAVHLDRALNLSIGDPNILVGIVDSGFAQVPDVAGKYAIVSWFTDEATNAYDDNVGHGTFNASLIAANNDDGKGLAGFCGTRSLAPSQQHAAAMRSPTEPALRRPRAAPPKPTRPTTASPYRPSSLRSSSRPLPTWTQTVDAGYCVWMKQRQDHVKHQCTW